MIWIALAILIAGFLISQVIEKHNKKIEELKRAEMELKQKELEANPEHRKKVALESDIETNRGFYESYLGFKKKDEESLKEAIARKDTQAIERWKKEIEEVEKKMKAFREEIQQARKQLNGI